jgi:hypothetical protein
MGQFDRIYFTFHVDCEPLSEKSPACGGPASWDISEKAIRKIREAFQSRGLLRAVTFMLTPEAAKTHADMMREWHSEGVNLGIQPNVPGFRYPTYEKDLGEYDEETQRRIITEATEDFESALGFRTSTYCACCGSKSPCTYRLLYEAGYREAFSPSPGRYILGRPDRCTEGVFPFPHWANDRHYLLPGTLPICVIPNCGDLSGGRDVKPRDLRSERPVSGDTHEVYRNVIDMAIELSGLMQAPVRSIVGPTHNTERMNIENVAYVLDYIREAVEHAGLELVPASPPEVRQALEDALPLSK